MCKILSICDFYTVFLSMLTLVSTEDPLILLNPEDDFAPLKNFFSLIEWKYNALGLISVVRNDLATAHSFSCSHLISDLVRDTGVLEMWAYIYSGKHSRDCWFSLGNSTSKFAHQHSLYAKASMEGFFCSCSASVSPCSSHNIKIHQNI